jgi:hypothetical protein
MSRLKYADILYLKDPLQQFFSDDDDDDDDDDNNADSLGNVHSISLSSAFCDILHTSP